MKKEDLFLYLITDRSWLNGKKLEEQVECAIKAGVTIVQLREKELVGEELFLLAGKVKEVCNKYKVPFIVNDDVELAKRLNADGVHVGQSDMAVEKAREILGPDKIIGATAKTVEQAVLAMKNGADYLGSGAVFGSSTKLDAKPMTKELFNEICASVSIPVVAIGGITGDNILELDGCKMAGVAVISGILAQPDIELATKDLLDKLNHLI